VTGFPPVAPCGGTPFWAAAILASLSLSFFSMSWISSCTVSKRFSSSRICETI
jgi:hypothetical protein